MPDDFGELVMDFQQAVRPPTKRFRKPWKSFTLGRVDPGSPAVQSPPPPPSGRQKDSRKSWGLPLSAQVDGVSDGSLHSPHVKHKARERDEGPGRDAKRYNLKTNSHETFMFLW